MKRNETKSIVAVVLAAAWLTGCTSLPGPDLAATAHAEYKCDLPPTAIDRRACEAAKEGPDSLRRFIQGVQPIANLQFSDYVSDATILAWEMNRTRERSASQRWPDATKPVATRQ
jgi:hypothetical protein